MGKYGVIPCYNCKKDVSIEHKSRLSAPSVCCSRECAAEYKKSLRKNNVTCPVCKKDFYLKNSALKKAKHSSCCSYKCMGEYRKKIYDGEKNPNYGNRGSKNPLYIGKRRRNGYVLLNMRDKHPFADSGNYVFEHRIVAENELFMTDDQKVEIDGKFYLSPEYEVHHKNQIKDDNRPENLEIVTKSEHMAIHSFIEKGFTRNKEIGDKYKMKNKKDGRGFEEVDSIFKKSKSVTKLPERSDAGSAGYDFFSKEDFVIEPGEQHVFWSDVKSYMGDGEYLSLYPRSSMGIKHGVVLSNSTGIIDGSFWSNPANDGNIGICLKNTSDKPYKISVGDKIAQGIFQMFLTTSNDNPMYEGRIGGFGSTGK